MVKISIALFFASGRRYKNRYQCEAALLEYLQIVHFDILFLFTGILIFFFFFFGAQDIIIASVQQKDLSSFPCHN